MNDLSGLTWSVVLAFGNLILSSAIVITAFSLLGYMVTRNLRSRVAQTFSALLACVLIVAAGDVIVTRVEGYGAAVIWLRVQWIGIGMVPAAYLHFSDALLRTTRHFSRRRRITVAISYLFSIALVFVALFTDALIREGPFTSPVNHLQAGPLFSLFVAYFIATALYGAYNVFRARRRCLTPTARRRMTYLTLSFAAPGLGVFPYLITSGLTQQMNPLLVLLLSMAANIAVGAMLVVMAYSVAYYGVLTPDRVVKHDLFHYLLRGPIVGIVVIVVMLVIPRVELILGLPRDTALVFAVVGVIVLGQLVISAAKPWIDRLIYTQDREEITWIQTLDQHLLTSSDLEQFLGNVLNGLCELLRVDTGVVLVQTQEGLRVEVSVGNGETASAFAGSSAARTAWAELSQINGGQNGEALEDSHCFRVADDYWYSPLQSQDGEKLLGLLAVRARSDVIDLDASESAEAATLLDQASAAIADRYVQEGVFATLQSILPDLERIQEWRSEVAFAPPTANGKPVDPKSPAAQDAWPRWVKDALSHYWGGPKLSESPLTGTELVKRTALAQGGTQTNALRAVLQEAIERQRPEGERKLTASEWVIYNILDLRFVQGKRVRDIAARLAISESDLYRKQRAAVAEVARTLAAMEAAAEPAAISEDAQAGPKAM